MLPLLAANIGPSAGLDRRHLGPISCSLRPSQPCQPCCKIAGENRMHVHWRETTWWLETSEFILGFMPSPGEIALTSWNLPCRYFSFFHHSMDGCRGKKERARARKRDNGMHGTHIGALVSLFLFHAGMQVQDILPGSPPRMNNVETPEAKLFSTIEG